LAIAEPWEAKLDHHLRAYVARRSGDPAAESEVISVLIRLQGPSDGLRAKGIQLRTMAGDIATASVALHDLPAVAREPAVVFIEMSRPLGPDEPSRAQAKQ
jgi:hypothetical protein